MPPVPDAAFPNDRASGDHAPDASASDALGDLSPDAWARVLEVFHDALARPPAERATFLEAACDGDAALRRRVEQLLGADDAGDAFTLLGTDGAALEAVFADGAAPEQVGPYRLGRELGRGGMGVVYAAERADVGTTVALKFLRERFPSAARLRRFEREQRVLGRLEHPGIARLLDAGVTAAGTPFFAMAYVEGTPITDYAAARGLGLRARLRLMRQACDAVAYAHRALVIHRDIKPSNLFVADGPDGPQVKLLDFGIAKLLDAGLDEAGGPAGGDAASLTRTGEHLLTPAYAAPEQLLGKPVTTATDVHALGVILHKLLTGAHPFGDADGPAADLAHRITPARPSAVASAAAGGVARVPADLDAVVQKALCKTPARRYASAADLGDDLGRVLADRPVAARPATTGYRLRTFVRRHRAPVLAGGALAVVLAALVSFYTWRLADARDRAEQEAATAQETADFVTSLFASNLPRDVPTDTITARTLLRRGRAQIDALDGQPAVQANLLTTLGRIYDRLGRPDTAVAVLRRALALRRTLYASPHPDLAAARLALGSALAEASQYDDAEPLLREAVRGLRTLHPRGHRDLAEALQQLGSLRSLTGAYEASLAPREEAYALYRRLLGPQHETTLFCLTELATGYYYADRYDEATARFQEAIAGLREAGHTVHLTHAMTNFAALRKDQGALEDALALHEDALARRRIVLGDDHPDVAVNLSQMAVLNVKLERYAAAEAAAREALALRLRVLGPSHARVATSYNQLAQVAYARAAWADAIDAYEQALAIYVAHYGQGHPYPATVLSNIGSTYYKAGRPADALAPLRRSLDSYAASSFGRDHWWAAYPRMWLGLALADLGRFAEGERYALEAYRLFRKQHAPPHPALATAATRAVRIHLAGGHVRAARAFADSVRAAGVDVAAADTLLAAWAR